MKSFQFYLIAAIVLSNLDVNSAALPVEWTNTMHPQGKNSDRASRVEVDAAGNIIVAGYAGRAFTRRDAFAIKYSPVGDTLWTYYYDGPVSEDDEFFDLALDAAGNVYLTGYSNGTNYQDECITVKLDAAGNVQWAQRYTGPAASDSHGNAIAVDATGNVYVGGFYDGPLGGMDGLVIQYNSSGSPQWTDLMNSPSGQSDQVNDIAIGPVGEVAICGTGTASGNYDVFVKEYTAGGGTAWVDTFNSAGTNADYAVAIAYMATGEIRVGGESNLSGAQGHNVTALGYDASGTRVWSTVYVDATTTIDEITNGMAIDTAGNVFLSANGFINQELFRINTDGSQGWKRSWRGPVANANDVAFGVAVDGAGNVYTTGKGIYPGPNYFGNNGLDLMTVVKYSGAGDSLWTYVQPSTTDISIGFGIVTRGSSVYAVGFKADSAFVDENFYTIILDTAGNAQTEWAYSGEGDAIIRGQFVRVDASDNIYVAGTCDRLYSYPPTFDVTIVSYDASGNHRWTQNYSSPGWRNDTLTGMEFDPAGNLILSISTDTGGTEIGYQLSLVKLSPAGILLDTRIDSSGIWTNLFANSMVVRSDGSTVLGCNAGTSGAMLFCYDSLLAPQWQAQLDSVAPTGYILNSIALFPNDDLAVVGTRDSVSFSLRKIFVQRISASGQRLWTSTIDSVNVPDDGRDVTVSPFGDVAVTGQSGGTQGAAITAKLNGTTGALAWQTLYNPSNSTRESGIKVRFTPAGNVAMLCSGWSGFVNRWFTAQYDGSSGTQQWAVGYSNVASERIPSELLVLPDSTVVTGGTQISNNVIPNWDYVLVGYSSTGVQRFVNLFSTPNIYPDRLHSIASDSQGNLVVTGESSNSFLNDYYYRMTTIKYGNTPVGVPEITQDGQDAWRAYPNPSSGQFRLLNTQAKGTVRIELFDATGRLMLHAERFQVGATLDLSAFPRGLYLLRIGEVNNGSLLKLVKE